MKINIVNNAPNFSGNFTQKIFRGRLIDDSTAVVRMSIDRNKNVKSIESYQFKNGKFLKGIGFGKNGGVRLSELAVFLDKLQSKAQEGTNFLQEFANALK